MRSRIILIMLGITVSMFLAWNWGNNADHDVPAEQIFGWVAEQMQVSVGDPLPPIHFVSKTELHRIFEDRSEQSFQSWQASYGFGRARQIMDNYLKDVVGMYNPNNGKIYVGQFLSPCRQRAILAHELVHYFQNKAPKDEAISSFDPAAAKMISEMEAYHIENRYMDQFCPEQFLE